MLPATTPRIERLKRAALVAAAVVLGLVAAELVARIGFLALHHRAFPRDDIRAWMARAAADGRGSEVERESAEDAWRSGHPVEVIHPYLGFVRDPDSNPDTSPNGFPADDPLPTSRDPRRLVVGVFGGSFAAGLSLEARDLLAAALAPLGREVVVVNLAAGAYKQPQQLMTLAWALSLGADLDIAINVDGFNEVVLPVVNNLARGVNPYYPRAWDQRVADVLTPEKARLLAAIAAVDESCSVWAERFLGWHLDCSVVACLLWRTRHLGYQRRRAALSRALDEARSSAAAGFLAHGPQFAAPADQDALAEILAEYWRACSLQMHRLCEANGIRYYHFLQPNQYDEGSKPMSRSERAVAFDEDHPYRPSVRRGYPRLRRCGAALTADGVRFTDLSMVFSGLRRPVYIDACCHVDRYGYGMIADAIGRVVLVDRDAATD